MNLRHFLPCLLGLVPVVLAAAAVNIGDTEQQVRQAKGAPKGTMQIRDVVLLRYPDETVKLKAGRVLSVEMVSPSAAEPSLPAPPPPARRSAPDRQVEPPSDTPVWITDYRRAMDQARKQRRHVFLFFTGSDWCGWCMKLHHEILSTPQFAEYAREKLVLVELDFPRSKPQSPELQAQNASLAREFGIRGYPTVVVLDTDGRPVGRLGYQRGGPQPFLAKLSEL